MQQNLAVENANIADDTSSMVSNSAHDYKVHPLAQLFKVAVTMGSFVVTSSAASAAANLQSFTLKRAPRNSISQAEHEMTTSATSYVTSPVGPILIADDPPTPIPTPTTIPKSSTFSGRKAISTLVKSLKRTSRAAASSVAKTVEKRRNGFTMGGGGSPVADASTGDIDSCIEEKATDASPANALPVAIAVDSANHRDVQPSSHGLGPHKTCDDDVSMNYSPWDVPIATLPREPFSPSKPPVVTVVIDTTAMESLKTQGQKDREDLQALNKRVGDLEGTLKQTNEERAVLSKQLADATAKISALPMTVTTAIRRDDMVSGVDSAVSVEPCVRACIEEKTGQEVDVTLPPSSVTIPIPSATTSTPIVRRNAFNIGRPTVSTVVVNKQLPLSSIPVKHHPASTHVKALLDRPAISHSCSPPPTPLQPTILPPAPAPAPALSTIIAEAPLVDVRVPALPTFTPVMSTDESTEGALLASSAIGCGLSIQGAHTATSSKTTVKSQPLLPKQTPIIVMTSSSPAPAPALRPIQTSTPIDPPPPPPHYLDAPSTRKSPKAKFNPLWQLPPKRGAKPARYIPPRSPSKKMVAQRVFEYSHGMSKGRLSGGGRLDPATTTATTKTLATSKGQTKDATVGVMTSSIAYPTSVPMQAISTGARAGVGAGVGVAVGRGEACKEVPESSSELMQSIRFGVALKKTVVGNATTKTINTGTSMTNSMPRFAAPASHYSATTVAVERGAQQAMVTK